MKKKLFVLTLCTSLLMCGCASNDELADAVKQAAEQAGQSLTTEAPADPAGADTDSATDTTSDSTGTADAEEPSDSAETELSLGDKGTVGDWNITVKKAAVKNKINDKFRVFKPNKGDTFVVANITATNTGSEDATLFPMVGIKGQMVTATVCTESGTEYQSTQLLAYDSDMINKSLKPKKKTNGLLAFSVSKKDAKSLKKLTLKIGNDEAMLSYSLK